MVLQKLSAPSFLGSKLKIVISVKGTQCLFWSSLSMRTADLWPQPILEKILCSIGFYQELLGASKERLFCLAVAEAVCLHSSLTSCRVMLERHAALCQHNSENGLAAVCLWWGIEMEGQQKEEFYRRGRKKSLLFWAHWSKRERCKKLRKYGSKCHTHCKTNMPCLLLLLGGKPW